MRAAGWAGCRAACCRMLWRVNRANCLVRAAVKGARLAFCLAAQLQTSPCAARTKCSLRCQMSPLPMPIGVAFLHPCCIHTPLCSYDLDYALLERRAPFNSMFCCILALLRSYDLDYALPTVTTQSPPKAVELAQVRWAGVFCGGPLGAVGAGVILARFPAPTCAPGCQH